MYAQFSYVLKEAVRMTKRTMCLGGPSMVNVFPDPVMHSRSDVINLGLSSH